MNFSSGLTALSLEQLAVAGAKQIKKEGALDLIFVCTHNARRSQLGQFWAAELAAQFGLNVNSFSGGTSKTEVHPNVIRHLKDLGYSINPANESGVFECQLSSGASILLFSKKTDDIINPKSNFIAIMTCMAADEACPFLPGALARISMPYTDPGKFDNEKNALKAYRACSEQIKADIEKIYSAIVQEIAKTKN